MAMLIQFLVGGIVCVCTITIHSLVMTAGGERSTSIEYNKKKPPVAAPDHHNDCNCFDFDGCACS